MSERQSGTQWLDVRGAAARAVCSAGVLGVDELLLYSPFTISIRGLSVEVDE